MDTKKLNMFMNILKFGLVAVGVIACMLVIGGPNMESTVEDQESFREGASLGMAINYTMLIIIASVAIVLLFFMIQLITNTKKTALSIIGVIVALVVYLIFWAMGTSDTNDSLALLESVQVEQGTIATTTAGIYTAIVGVAVGALVWILSPLMGRLRK
jgi:hypothetical protein